MSPENTIRDNDWRGRDPGLRLQRLAVRCRPRSLSGITSGAATGTIGTYVNELSPPHLCRHLGLGRQISTTRHPRAGHLLLLRRQRRWRYMTGFPIVLAVIFIVLSPSMSVESPAWLLMKNRREEAKQVITRLYGEEHVHTALGWLEPKKQLDEDAAGY
jgi:hypothetical protein